MEEIKIKTPCIGVCSTVFGDAVCRGCKRFVHEVIAWNGYSQGQKKAVVTRLETLLSQLVADKLSITDSDLLRDHIARNHIRVPEYRNDYCRVYELLRAGAGQIDDSESFGFRLHAPYQGMALEELVKQIDEEFFVLSEAHYQRYLL